MRFSDINLIFSLNKLNIYKLNQAPECRLAVLPSWILYCFTLIDKNLPDWRLCYLQLQYTLWTITGRLFSVSFSYTFLGWVAVTGVHPFPPGDPPLYYFSSHSACLTTAVFSDHLNLQWHWKHSFAVVPQTYNSHSILWSHDHHLQASQLAFNKQNQLRSQQ